MTERVLKDIRFYESDKPNIDGQSLPGELGKLFVPTKDTHYIGQRIARKLNELGFCYGGFDHIYINLTTVLAEHEIVISDRDVDKRIKYLDVGIHPERLNRLTDSEKDEFTVTTVFTLLEHISTGSHLERVRQAEALVAEFGAEIKIHFKAKETKAYRIDIDYQIESPAHGTNAIIVFTDKQTDDRRFIRYKLRFYDDLYTLINTVALKDGAIICQPKTSFSAGLNNRCYQTPIVLKLSDFEKTNCHE
ncbi:MAG: hypothetical protein Q4G28_04340 [Neisseria sp.]|nr:hypothetical protein [Neisseria sp.]